MGFLDKLWDDSLAGPCPDTGLAKLRETTITKSSIPIANIPEGVEAVVDRLRERRASAEYKRSNYEARQVMQGIAIIKPPGGYLPSLSVDTASSPATSSPLNSPSSLTPQERDNSWRSNKHKKGSEKSPRAEPRSPTVYDWVVFNALDG